MSLYIKLFFRSDNEITANEVFGALLASGLDVTQPSREQWQQTIALTESGVNFQYDLSSRPIRIYYSSHDNAVNLSTSILDELLSEQGIPSDIVNRLQNTKQCVDIEVNPDSISHNVWDALDSFEKIMMEKYDGVLYVHGEGIYDSDLNIILSSL